MNGIGLGGEEMGEGTTGVHSNSRGSSATAPEVVRRVLHACTLSISLTALRDARLKRDLGAGTAAPMFLM
jgi:hypothetical protein